MTTTPLPRHLRSASAALAVVVALALAGCSGEEQEPESGGSAEAVPVNPGGGGADEESESESAEPSESEAESMTEEERRRLEEEMTPGDVSDAQLKAVRAYLKVRENSESVRYEDPEEWKSALEKVTTSDGLDSALETYRPAETSNARMVASQQEYEVSVAVGSCVENPGYGGGESELAVQCQLTDLVHGPDGLVDSQDVDNTWPYFGEQEPPMLLLSKEDGEWLVDGDFTGRAS